jgi:hypothetical protein
MSIAYRVEQPEGTVVWTGTSELADYLTVPAEYTNLDVTAVTYIFENDALISVVYPIGA